MPHELSLTTRQTTKIRNAFANNMLTNTKLNKVEVSKKILSGGSFVSWLANLGKETLKNLTLPLARDSLPGLVGNFISLQ